MNQSFFASHSGKGTFGVFLAALLLAWPPACAYIAAAMLIGYAAFHLKVAFQEIEHGETSCLDRAVGSEADQFFSAYVGNSTVTGPSVVPTHVRSVLPRGGVDPREEGRHLIHDKTAMNPSSPT